MIGSEIEHKNFIVSFCFCLFFSHVFSLSFDESRKGCEGGEAVIWDILSRGEREICRRGEKEE